MANQKYPILFNIFKNDPYFSAIIFRTIVFGFSLINCLYMNKYEENFVMYCTNWGQIITTIYYFLSLMQAVFRQGEESAFTRALSLIYHLCLSFQFLIFVFYWPLLSWEDMMRILSLPEEWRRKYEFFAQSLWRHLVNPLLIWLPLLTNYTKFYNSNVVFLLVFAASYMYTNFWFTQKLGKPVYPTMNWKNTESHINVILGIGLAFGGFFLASSISKAMRKRFNLDAGFAGGKVKGK